MREYYCVEDPHQPYLVREYCSVEDPHQPYLVREYCCVEDPQPSSHGVPEIDKLIQLKSFSNLKQDIRVLRGFIAL